MKLRDQEVMEILRANASKNQGTEKPILPLFYNADGSLNRETTIAGPAYTLTDEEKADILALGNEGQTWGGIYPPSHFSSNPPRCECHECTQARYRGSFQWQLDQYRSPSPNLPEKDNNLPDPRDTPTS